MLNNVNSPAQSPAFKARLKSLELNFKKFRPYEIEAINRFEKILSVQRDKLFEIQIIRSPLKHLLDLKVGQRYRGINVPLKIKAKGLGVQDSLTMTTKERILDNMDADSFCNTLVKKSEILEKSINTSFHTHK